MADSCQSKHVPVKKNNNEDELLSIRTYLTEAFIFMNKYHWISNSYVAEFFTQQLWEKLPTSWQSCLNTTTLEDVASNILCDESRTYKAVWPLSLLSFVATSHALALNRRQKTFSDCIEKPDVLTGIFQKHIKPKKRHELSLLPQVIHTVCKETSSKNVVDVGSGLGHLSRILAYKYGYNITAIEMAGQRLPAAEKFDREIEETLKKSKSEEHIPLGEVKHVAKKVLPDISTQDFLQLLNFSHENSLHNTQLAKNHCVLVGLHTCGDLASTMLKVFRNTTPIKGLVSVSCCYFRMTLKEDCNHDSNNDIDSSNKNHPMPCLPLHQYVLCRQCRQVLRKHEAFAESESCKEFGHTDEGHVDGREKLFFGFPMSNFLQQLHCQPLRYKSFEAACHFLDDYAQKLKDHSPNLKLHCYRAVMEVFIRHVDPKLVLAAIRCKKIKNAANMTFIEYAEKVFERLGKRFDAALLNEIDFETLLAQWKNVAIYHSLALLLGPVVESIALMDKLLYLKEKGFHASITPIFDPKLSPRNFVLVATRPE